MRRIILLVILFTLVFAGAAAAYAQDNALGYACPGAPIPRLIAGQQGRVTPGLPNVLRSQPGRGWNSAVIGEIPGGGVFTVLAGYAAQCADGMWWYYVSYNGLAGWTAEGANYGEYWTEPLGAGTYCYQSVRLVPGQRGRVTPGLPNLLRTQPYRGGGSAVVGQIPGGAVFDVLYGYAAQCGDGMWWHYVSYNGVAGWTPEGDGYATYWTEPHHGGSGTDVCGNGLPPRLTAGQWGRVTPGLPNTLRAWPALNAPRTGRVPGSMGFYVMSGPQCADGMVWWQVDYNGVTGWTAEGRWGTYWLEPWY
jgi:hypothetical protein